MHNLWLRRSVREEEFVALPLRTIDRAESREARHAG